jgi:hypothetical protein
VRVTSAIALTSILLLPSTAQQVRSNQAKSAKSTPEVLIAKCLDDGIEILLPEYPAREKVARVADVDLEAAFPTESEGATFWFVRGQKEIFKFTAKDLDSRSVWMAVDHDGALASTYDQAHIALTYSEGGALGRFQVRIFLIDGNGVRDVSNCIDGAVADFKARHHCKPRGNNVSALKWVSSSLLILTEVYPTGDCGPDFGHLEGYLVSVPQGKTLEHINVNQLRHYPGVCLQNADNN